ncbi:MAG: hypothetical protein K9M44_00270 [Candidatus Pacebacteria bacterium]|nr:hypothetical protein [Candidatus Paceibacterota bacterium]
MKYNININQIVLSQTRLDIIDGAILDYLYYLCSSRNKRVEEKRKNGYTWVNFNYLMEEMPMLGIKSKSRISERIRKIAKEGFLRTMRDGNKFYVELTEKIDEVFVKTNDLSPPSQFTIPTVRQNERSTPSSVRQNEHNHNTNNHYIKKNVNVVKKLANLSDTERGQLEYHLEKINDQRNVKAWLEVVGQIGFQTVINILIDVSQSMDAKNKGACAMGLAKKAGYKKFFRPNKDRL